LIYELGEALTKRHGILVPMKTAVDVHRQNARKGLLSTGESRGSTASLSAGLLAHVGGGFWLELVHSWLYGNIWTQWTKKYVPLF